MTTVTIEGNHLVVRLSGWSAVLALKREVRVPLAHVVSVTAGQLTSMRPDGIRLGGSYLPKRITAGHYWWKGRGWSFWSVRHKERAIDIQLRDEHFRRLVVEVDDPIATATTIKDAIQSPEGEADGRERRSQFDV